jgi:ech hydrogenase subunit A
VFPLLAALILLFVKSDKLRGPLVIIFAILIGIGAIVLAVQNFGKGQILLFSGGGLASEVTSYVMMGIEAVLALLIVCLGIKHKKYLASILALVQCPLLIWFELTKGHTIEIEKNIAIDNFSMIMVLIIGIIGTLICVYAVGYMKDFQHHHAEEKDRRPLFFFLMFLFLSAMFGIVLSNNLIWMYFFWEITTLCSFFLIGYTRTPEAVKNSFRAIIMNLLGGLAFVLALIVMGNYLGSLELNALITNGLYAKSAGQSDAMVVLNVITALLAFAGITKAAQMPFNSWLLGAMVAPTPTSALLHSSTMVKAGVFLIVKLSPLLGVNNILDIGPGFMVVMVGGITFLLASFAAVSQSNAKRVLAYSTIANLGLIVACAGIGTAEGVWAATMLIIFHAATKSLLFLSVGTAEHNIGSRDIEDMDGLFGRMPRLAVFMIIGISAMFLAPFGMLISKWAALQSFIDSSNIWVVLMVCFGSSVTLFYWAKWLGKLAAIVANRQNIQDKVHGEEWSVLGGHVILVVLISLTFPLISDKVLLPYLNTAFQGISDASSAALSSDNMIIMVVMVALILVLPLLFYGRTNKKIVPLYMAGANEGDNLTFKGSLGKDVPVSLRNWYMEDIFKEKLMNRIGIIATCIIFSMTFSYAAAVGIRLYELIKGGVI